MTRNGEIRLIQFPVSWSSFVHVGDATKRIFKMLFAIIFNPQNLGSSLASILNFVSEITMSIELYTIAKIIDLFEQNLVIIFRYKINKQICQCRICQYEMINRPRNSN